MSRQSHLVKASARGPKGGVWETLCYAALITTSTRCLWHMAFLDLKTESERYKMVPPWSKLRITNWPGLFAPPPPATGRCKRWHVDENRSRSNLMGLPSPTSVRNAGQVRRLTFFSVIDRNFFEMTEKIKSIRSRRPKIYRLVHTVTTSFTTVMRQITEMSQRKKEQLRTCTFSCSADKKPCTSKDKHTETRNVPFVDPVHMSLSKL